MRRQIRSTVSSSRPRIAAIEPGFLRAASAIASPRSRTSAIASSTLIADAAASAANSPTEWPMTKSGLIPRSRIAASSARLVATSLAVLEAIKKRGIKPDFVVGHSVGEFAALAAAGAMKIEEAIALVRERGLAMAEAAKKNPGSMAAILGLDDETVERICRRILNVWPANYNCPGQVVVSGENPAVDEACDVAEREGARRAVKLRVSGAFHSPLVARAADRLRPALDRVRFAEPAAPFMSTVTARIETAKRVGPLLVEQLTAPVRFTQAAQALLKEGVQTWVEVGPGNVLAGLVKRIDGDANTISVATPEGLDRLEETLSAV